MSTKQIVRPIRRKVWTFIGAIRYTTSLLPDYIEHLDDKGSTILLTLVTCDTELLRMQPEENFDLNLLRNIYRGEIRGGTGVVFTESKIRKMIHHKYHELQLLSVTPSKLKPMDLNNVLSAIDHVVSQARDCAVE